MSGDSRLPAHLEISALIRLVETTGGFATVLAKGERDAGTILLVTQENGRNAQLYERMPQLDGGRAWTLVRKQDTEKPNDFSDYLDRRRKQDSDVWILEADIADGAQFVESLPR
ncbi:DUF1491 family protein [Parerythrobacter aestuarii]|uniref:DUF1491 family protein n=1 Tax=Parerythrobacter aestuarii TaxID=3020909 RepID=UPI0024DE9116|nr:DUF1491 family protein [Parerythrobacter aestuarii]